MRKCSTLIIGSGQSGMEVAEFLADNNQYTILVEQDELGGSYTTLHDLVLKDALEFSKHFHTYLAKFRSFPQTYDVLLQERSTLLGKIKQKEDQRLEELTTEYTKNPNIELVRGQARFISPSLVEVATGDDRELISFDYCVCAIGKQDIETPLIAGADLNHVWNEYTIFNAQDLPESICIIGCTEETLNFAFLFSGLGIKVHICDQKKAEACLPQFDKTILNSLFKKLLSNQVEFHFYTDIKQIAASKKGISVIAADKTINISDVLLTTKKVFADTVGAQESLLKFTPNGLVTNSEGKVYGGEKIYAVGEANDRYELGKNQEIMHNCLYALSQEFKKSKAAKATSSTTMTIPNSSDPEFIRGNHIYPRMVGNFEGITLGLPEHQARSLYGSVARSDAYETRHGDIVKVIYNAQTEKLIGIGLSGPISKECLLYATYCIDNKRKHSEFSTYLRSFLEFF